MTKIKFLINFLKTQKGIALSLIFFAIVFNAVFLWSEIATPTFNFNDEVLHLISTREASSVLQKSQDPTDFWLPQIGLGFPSFHYYQHFPHLFLTILNHLLPLLSLSFLFDFTRYLLLVLFPISIFLAMRRFGFDYLVSGISALISSLLSTNALYGIDYGSYIWRGSGLYTQLWAMFFLPLALAEIYHSLTKKTHLFWAILFSTIVLLSNLTYGYILFLSAILFNFLNFNKKEIISRLKISVLIFLCLGLVTSYFWIPFFLDKTYLNRSIWEASFKYDSFGIFKVLTDLFKGNLLDYGRFPSLTILFFLGIVMLIVLKRYKEENYRLLLLFTIFWLFLYFGRPTWGPLLNILPFSQYLYLHRFIGGFHLGAIMIIGAGLALIIEKAQEWRKKIPSYLFLILTIIISLAFLSPVYIERIKYYSQNSQWRLESQKAFSIEKNELSEIEKTLNDLPRGRIYIGLPSTWGNTYYYKIGFVPLYAIFPQLGFDTFGYTYHPLAFSDDIRLHFDDTKPVQYNLFNIRYVLLHKTWAPAYYYSKIKEFENYILYEVPTTGYFDLVDAPAVFYGKTSDFYYPNSKWFFSALPELKQHPILELGEKPKKTFGLPVLPFQKVDEKILSELSLIQAERGRILKEKVDLNKYLVQFEANRDCYLMLKANYHPGWQVYLDYEKVEPVMLTPGFIGIKVTPGIHQALFLYHPPSYRIPLLILGIIILFSISFYGKRRIPKTI